MNKLTIAAVLSLAGIGLPAAEALAGGCCGSHHCTKKFKVVCSQYNAFSPFCCIPVAHGFRKHGCCAPNLIMPYYQMCGVGCGPAGAADAGCPGGNCQAPSAVPAAAPQVQAMMMPPPGMPAWNYPAPPLPPPNPMLAGMPPMMLAGLLPIGPSALYPPYPQGYPAGYYPPPNQALIAPPGTMGMPPTGFPTDTGMPSY